MKLIKYVLKGFAILIIGILLFLYIFFYSDIIIRNQGGALVKTVVSPNKNYIAEAYIDEVNNLSVRVDLINTINNSRRVIYWSWNEYEYGNGYDPKIEWIDNNYIIINGRKLNVKNDKYDRRYMSDDKYLYK